MTAALRRKGDEATAMPSSPIASARRPLAEPQTADGGVWRRFLRAVGQGDTGGVRAAQCGMPGATMGNHSPPPQGFSCAPSRMDKLLGSGHVR